MKKGTAFFYSSLIGSILLSQLAACDWIHNSFINSIPFKGNPNQQSKEFHVYLGVDGLSWYSVNEAMKNGAFKGDDWKLAQLVTPFPGTSDYSWTRTMHTRKMKGYEIEFFNNEESEREDALHNAGMKGLSKHLMPALSDTFSFQNQYFKAFDLSANGFSHVFNAYQDTYISLGNTLDNLFFTLGGRIETDAVFSAYILEFDVLGHMRGADEVQKAIKILSKKMEQFRKSHPNHQVHFTLFSDHGMDFIRPHKEGGIVVMADELKKVGITPVESFAGHDPRKELYAVPVMHTRVNYIALHTPTVISSEVAARSSLLPSVDLVVSRGDLPEDLVLPVSISNQLEWWSIWSEGKEAIRFAFDSTKDVYYLPRKANYERLNLNVTEQVLQNESLSTVPAIEGYYALSDEATFSLTQGRTYPDLFYRTRTSLSEVAVEYPADVMISFRPAYASLGFKIPGVEEISTSGLHGSLDHFSSLGTLLTTERELPSSVRSDTLFDLFPKIKEHTRELKTDFVEGDPHAGLNYLAIPKN